MVHSHDLCCFCREPFPFAASILFSCHKPYCFAVTLFFFLFCSFTESFFSFAVILIGKIWSSIFMTDSIRLLDGLYFDFNANFLWVFWWPRLFGTIKSSAQLVLLRVDLYWTIASLDLLQSSRIFSGCKWEAFK